MLIAAFEAALRLDAPRVAGLHRRPEPHRVSRVSTVGTAMVAADVEDELNKRAAIKRAANEFSSECRASSYSAATANFHGASDSGGVNWKCAAGAIAS